MAFTIIYKDYTFSASDIVNLPNAYRTISLLMDSLAYDTFHFKVKVEDNSTAKLLTSSSEWVHTSDNRGVVIGTNTHASDESFMEYDYGEPVYVIEDGVQKALFYLEKIEPVGASDEGVEIFLVSCISVVGILSKITHRGGIYNGDTVGSIISDIMGDLPYTIDPDVSATLVYGWLPYVTDARQNLQQVLFASGASILRNNDGTIRFSFNQQALAKTIPTDRIFLGGSAYGKKERKSKIVVTEHMYFQSADAEEILVYDNRSEATPGTTLQVFDQPYYSFRATGLTIVSSGANWAEVSGTGCLYAKPYIHSSREISRVLDATVKGNEEAYTNMTLASSANVNSILDRICNYYSNAEIRNFDIVVSDEKPGDLVEFEDRTHRIHAGYIQDIDESASSFWRGRLTVATNWSPTSGGNDYDSYLIIKGSDLSGGTWTVPQDMRGKRARVVLFSGAQGGQGGYGGAINPRLNRGSGQTTLKAIYAMGGLTYAAYLGGRKGVSQGLPGGAGGQGGNAASKLVNIDIDELESSYSVSFGAGGAGGAGGVVATNTPPTMGSLGGASVFDGISTDDGMDFAGTYINIVTGDIVAQPGPSGIAGARGGNGGLSTSLKTFNSTEEVSGYSYASEGMGSAGGNVGQYRGGAGVEGVNGIYFDNTGGEYSVAQKHLLLCCAGGGGGGGAAMGANGGVGTVGQPQTYSGYDPSGQYGMLYYYANSLSGVYPEGTYRLYCSVGGDGASATIVPAQTVYTGGQGGHGGGGGGGAGESLGNATIGSTYLGESVNGMSGNGGQGGQGSDGFAIVYYKS